MKENLKQRKIEGLLAVLDSLTVLAAYKRKFTTGGRCKGYLPFEQPLNLTCILTLCMLEVESMSLWPNRGLNLKKSSSSPSRVWPLCLHFSMPEHGVHYFAKWLRGVIRNFECKSTCYSILKIPEEKLNQVHFSHYQTVYFQVFFILEMFYKRGAGRVWFRKLHHNNVGYISNWMLSLLPGSPGFPVFLPYKT